MDIELIEEELRLRAILRELNDMLYTDRYGENDTKAKIMRKDMNKLTESIRDFLGLEMY